jgi:hypothetical protein
MPSPADLSRRRPRLVPPPKPEPSRGRGLAEREKERAQRALRALVADPATDLAALDGDEFSAALRCACEEGGDSPALVAEAERRIGSGLALPRDLHQVLIPAGMDPAAGKAWDRARTAAMAAIARQPHLAVEVLALEGQRPGVSGMRVTESEGTDGFTALASLERHGEPVEGRRCTAGSKKRARQEAALSLLSAVTGRPVPATEAPVVAAPASHTPGLSAPGMSAADLEAWLDYEITKPEPDGELARAVQAGRLSARALYLLLFAASPGGWTEQRAIAWDALTRSPLAAPGVLSMHTQARGLPPASYLEPAAHVAVAFLVTPDGPVVGEHAAAASQKPARAAAALTLIRDLAEPAGLAPAAPAVSRGGDNPVGTLNERAQTGVITGLGYETGGEGQAHQPLFTCTASCRHATGDYACTAEGRSKTEAKSAAAAGLLDQLAAAERSVVARLAQVRRDQALSDAGIFERLLRAGCAVEFAPRGGFRLGDSLTVPLAGWSLPLVPALPVLAALDSGTGTDNGAVLHPSAREWAVAARAALEAVAARRVYPAADDEGRDCWRIERGVHGPQAFLDSVADALLRPPGGRLVIGDLPYVGRPRLLSGDGTDWADRVADAVEGIQPASIVLRISPPAADGEPLRAELHAARLGRAEHRLLRRAARDWPPLSRVVADGVLSGTAAADLLGEAGRRLAAHAITVEWPADLVASPASGTGEGGLRRNAVVRSRASADGTFSVAGAAELTWRLELDGESLSAEEMAAVGAAVEGVLRLRGCWVVIGPQARQQETAITLTGAQSLAAALTGQVTVDGTAVPCTAAGHLADVAAALRGAGQDATAVEDLAIDGLKATLRGYQRQGVGWLRRLAGLGFGALLADDMGLGKTLTIIAFHLSSRGDGPALVVCPASLLANWEREFARFAPGVPVRRYHGAGRSLDALGDGEVVVTTYGTLLRDAERLAGVAWDLVVADEAQQVKNHRSQAARALRLLRPVMRVAVTGTPVENSLSELWAILDWANPGLLGSLAAFRERYGRAAERAAGPGDDEVAAEAARRLGRLIAPFVLRRRKTDPGIVPELPEKMVSDRYVQLGSEQAALYQAAVSRLIGTVTASSGIGRRGQVMRLLQSLRQICNSPAHFLRESAEGWDADAQAARSGKLAALEELLKSVTAAGEAALIFTSYVSMGHLLQAHLAARGITAGFLHGAVPVGRRQQVVDAFQTGSGDALILSVRAAGTGLTLTRAGHVIHFDRPWNPAVEDQATDRAHRIGASRLVEVHHLITEGTVEDRIAELLARKRGLADAVLASGEVALTDLSDGELRALVSLGKDQGGA